MVSKIMLKRQKTIQGLWKVFFLLSIFLSLFPYNFIAETELFFFLNEIEYVKAQKPCFQS